MMTRLNPSCRQVQVLLVVVLLGLAGVSSCQRSSPPAPRPPLASQVAVDDLVTDIELLDTINRLQLTKDQLDSLLDLVDRIEELTARYDQRIQGLDSQYQPRLARQRDLLIKDQPPSPQLAEELQQWQQQRQQVSSERAEALHQLIPELRAVLTDSQVQIVSGADEARLQARDMLQWLREMPAAEFQEEARANAEALAAPEIDLNSSALLDIFTTARNMSAEQYRTAQPNLVDRLSPIYGDTAAATDRLLLRLFANGRVRTILAEKAALARR